MIADSILSLTMLTIILLLFYGPWQELCAGIARQLIFERRNLTFNFAQRGDLDFNSKEYRDIRNFLNMMIRFAHKATLPRLLFLSICLYREPINETGILQNNVTGVPNPEIRNELCRIIDEVEIITLSATAVRSIWFWICLPFVILPIGCALSIHGYREKAIIWLRSFGDRVRLEAECMEVI